MLSRATICSRIWRAISVLHNLQVIACRQFRAMQLLILLMKQVEAVQFALQLLIVPRPKNLCLDQNQITTVCDNKIDVFLVSLD